MDDGGRVGTGWTVMSTKEAVERREGTGAWEGQGSWVTGDWWVWEEWGTSEGTLLGRCWAG